MPAKYQAKHIRDLLEALADKAGVELEWYGLGVISDMMEGVSQRYLYESLWQKVRHSTEGVLKLAPGKIEGLAHFLGYESVADFIKAKENPLPSSLSSLEGVYYSYVRKNSHTQAEVLRSPVRIMRRHEKMIWQLNGPKWRYEGELIHTDGCVFCAMHAPVVHKTFYHVYKIGKSEAPEVLMGVFSGVSSAGDPIGGRCVLVRQSVAFDTLNNGQTDIEVLRHSSDGVQQKLAVFFEKYEDNNLRINPPVGFDIDDL